MHQRIKLLGLLLTLFPCLFVSAQTSLAGPVILNGGTVLDETSIGVPTAGMPYVIASGNRIRGEYILSIEGTGATQTVCLLVQGDEYDSSATLQLLDNYSYNGAVMLTNFQFLMSPSNGYNMYLVVDVPSTAPLLPNNNTSIRIQYQGDAEYPSSFGGTLRGDTVLRTANGIAVYETSVAIGTQSPQTQLSVMNGMNGDQDDNNSGSFPFNTGVSFVDSSGEAISSNRRSGVIQVLVSLQ